ncbi:PAS domain S-box protein [Deinococcus radiotolerans]|uniref:histidine kinase n=1 Tax=Deinococcus radiotolerans TaxID=1309407 RepID=A0ABQ2FHL2_9DEIO|nr:PAS domain S-box protein [Deinococcus radiotolerans]GGK99408.1 hypothetical protein GCM10010844_17050 [Deinococcus radiotolerans]
MGASLPDSGAPFDVLMLCAAADPANMAALLADIPAAVPVVVAVPSGQGRRFQSGLACLTPHPVYVAEVRTALQSGQVYVVAGPALVETQNRQRGALVPLLGGLDAARPLDQLLASLAMGFGSRVLTVFLADAATDGRLGARALRGVGGTILVRLPEDPQASVPADLLADGTATGVPADQCAHTVAALLSGHAHPGVPTEGNVGETLRRQRFLLTFSDALRPLTDASKIQKLATRLLREYLGVSRCIYTEFVVKDGCERVVIAAEHYAPGTPSYAGVHLAAPFGPDVPALRAGRMIVVPDIEAEDTTEALRETWRGQSVRARLGVPVVEDGRLVVVLGVQHDAPRVWRAEDVELVREVAERTCAAAARARADRALRESEVRYRSLFDAMTEGLALCDVLRDDAGRVVDLRYTEMNRGMEEQTGLTRGAVLGRRLSEVVPLGDLARWLPIYSAVTETGEPVRFEQYAELVDRWFAVSVYPRAHDELAILAHDITGRRRAEQARAQLEAQMTLLLQLSDALRPLSDPEEIQDLVTAQALTHFGADRCYYCEIEGDLALIRRDAARGDLPSVAGTYPLSDFPLVRAVIEAGQPFVVPDVNTTSLVDDALKDVCRRLQVISFIGVPVIRRGQALGLLCLVQSAPRRWTDLHVTLAVDVAERTWAAVERVRAERARTEADDRLRRLIEHLPGGAVFVVDHDLRYLLAQGEALATAGFTPDGLVGRTVKQVLPVALVAEHEAMYRRALSGQHFEVEHAAHGRQYLTRGLPLYDAAGQVTSALAMSYDITARKQAEEAVRDSEARLAAILEALPVGAGLVNTEGRVLLGNQELKRFLPNGLMPALDPEQQGRWLGFDEQGRRVEPHNFPGARALRGEKVVPGIEMQYTQNDGTDIWTRVAAVPLRDAAGHITGQVPVVMDVNDLKRAQAALRLLNSDLEARVEERTRRLADLNAELSHVITRTARNLKTPAAYFSQWLESGHARDLFAGPSAAAPDALERSLAQLRGVALDLQALAHLESQALHHDLVPLAELFTEVRAAAPARATWFIQPLPIVRADRALLRQALEVLLNFTLSDTRGARYVDVASQAVQGEVWVSVSDDGTGLSGEEAATLFDLTVRSEQAVPVLDGSGLMQVRRILARHGGWAWAEARLTGGRVVLAFPQDETVTELEDLLRGEQSGF